LSGGPLRSDADRQIVRLHATLPGAAGANGFPLAHVRNPPAHNQIFNPMATPYSSGST
jgi:hypothetical protein